MIGWPLVGPMVCLNGKKSLKLHFTVLTIVYCAGIFWLSSGASPVDPTPLFPGQDKLVHIAVYGGLAALVSTGIRRSGKPASFAKQFWAPALFATAYGIFDEFHQLFVPHRFCEAGDMLANAAGALLIQFALCYGVWRLNSGRNCHEETP
ncbi:MAG TPA: VanZ family protein [Candidatus Hydrogenedentes bacterium]|nr:VanZ family protein [Candidatus Hydrogenedentota bacterium]HOT50389.1 VanZ family protein [Candidatus Hydrogenedentota bacterium]HOV73225.1 VanZ family protein [Candidatus Hydrogenedentota bacterium]HPC17450.1 VanZ family protein [Candidatus Hydrogenedentota bacterium]HRT20042.1 VanZ family protein [Candidatus Hydrogenedentota bacterium]